MTIQNGQLLPHSFLSPDTTDPRPHLTLEKTCWNDDLSAVVFIPRRVIMNSPAATAYRITNNTASLFTSTASSADQETLSPCFITSEKRTSNPFSTTRLFLPLGNDSHPGTVTSFSWHAWHPGTDESVSLISFFMEERNSSLLRMMLHCIPGNLIEKWCSISFGAVLPVIKSNNLNFDYRKIRPKWFEIEFHLIVCFKDIYRHL